MILPNLPRESAFKRAVDPEGAQWGATEYLLADLFDLTVAANSDGKKQAKPYPRPADQARERDQRGQRMAALRAQKQRAIGS